METAKFRYVPFGFVRFGAGVKYGHCTYLGRGLNMSIAHIWAGWCSWRSGRVPVVQVPVVQVPVVQVPLVVLGPGAQQTADSS